MKTQLRKILSILIISFVGTVTVAQENSDSKIPKTDTGNTPEKSHDPCDANKDGEVSYAEERGCRSDRVITTFLYSKMRPCPSGHCQELFLKEELVIEKGLELKYILVSKDVRKPSYKLESTNGKIVGKTLNSPVKLKGYERYNVYPVKFNKGLSANDRNIGSISRLIKMPKVKIKDARKIPPN